MIHDHAAYLEKIFHDEQERRAFADAFETSDIGMRHATLRADQAARAASLAATGPALKAAVDQLLKDSPGLPLEVAYRTAGRQAGIL